MPNEILRSALFNCRNRKQPRMFMKDIEIALIGDGQVIYRGEELRQDDELVWLHLMHLIKKLPLGECVDFTPYSFVKTIGWPIKGQSYERLRISFSRMQATAIRIQSKRLGCFISVSLILKFRSRNEQNENLPRWQVWVGEEMRLLFDEEFLTRMNWELRKSLPDGICPRCSCKTSGNQPRETGPTSKGFRTSCSGYLPIQTVALLCQMVRRLGVRHLGRWTCHQRTRRWSGAGCRAAGLSRLLCEDAQARRIP